MKPFTVEDIRVSRRAIDQYHASWSKKVLIPVRTPPPWQVCLPPYCTNSTYQFSKTKREDEKSKLV
jgi:hypothetical protein